MELAKTSKAAGDSNGRYQGRINNKQKESKMTNSEFKKAVKKATAVFGWVRLNENDGAYIKLVKADILYATRSCEDVDADFRDADDLYIN